MRSLSTGINDPFTAMTCADRISSLIARLTERSFPEAARFDDQGRLRIVAETPTFAEFVDAAFHQIRQNSSTPPVLIHMLEAIRRIGEQASSDEQRRSLADHARLILDTGLEKEPAGPGRRALEAAYSEALGAIGTIRDLHTSLPDGLRAGS